jgi:uncharacterized protein YxjI
MQYVMASKWSLMERFEITDSAGAPQFEARGHLGSQITLHDTSGQEVAEIRKHLMTDTHDVYVAGQQVAQVRHGGIFGDKYDIESSYGVLNARGRFAGGDYTISRGGMPVATMVRQFALREKFAIEVADSENQVFGLAVVLAIEAIHDERERQQHRGGFGLTGLPGLGSTGGGIGGILGGNFP